MRAWHGFTLSTNYTFSRASMTEGPSEPAILFLPGTLANDPNASYPADRIECGVSTSNQPQHFVLTGVWNLPFGKTILDGNSLERAILGGFMFSGIYQVYSGSPLALTATSLPDESSADHVRTHDQSQLHKQGRAPKRQMGTRSELVQLQPAVESRLILHRPQRRQDHDFTIRAICSAGASIRTDDPAEYRDCARATPSETRRVPRLTTSTAPATTNSISPWSAVSRCTSGNRQGWISVPSGTTSRTTRCSPLPAPRLATQTSDKSPRVRSSTARLHSSQRGSSSRNAI